ncbi:MAG: porin [Pseudomonadota bacterium]
MNLFTRRLAVASLLLLGTLNARAEAEVVGRLNLSLERRGGGQSVVADNASRIGFIDTEHITPDLFAGVHLEKGFDGSSGAQVGNGFDRMAELSIGNPAFWLSLGRFGSTAYLGITDVVSLHNHDTGISADALFAHVEPLGRKLGVTGKVDAWTLQLVKWMADPVSGASGGNAALLAYDRPGLSLAVSSGQDARRFEHSVRMLASHAGVDVAFYVEQDNNVLGRGKRLAKRAALAWHVGPSEWHWNEGRAGAYRGGAPGESGARQSTLAYNYNLSARTKVYALATRLRDQGRLYGNWSSTAIGLRQNF